MAESELEHFVDLCTAAAIHNVSDLKLEASDSGDDCVEILDSARGSSDDDEEDGDDDDDVSLVVVEAAAEEHGAQVRWTQELNADEVKVEAFTRSSGPVHSLKPGAEPLEFLKLFLDDALMERIAAETNRCAAQSNAVAWKPATRATVSTFLGILLVMGINVLPELNQYWATDDCLGNQFIQRAMSRNRFKNLMRYLRLTDDEKMPKKGEAGYDPLYRVRPLIDHLLAAFHRRFVPFRDIAVDEAACRFKGTMESSSSPRAEAKPAKYGIKVFTSACAASGYVHSFFVHTGADEYPVRHGVGHHTMMQLTRRLRGHRHHVYFGKFFTSSQLLRDLLRRGLYACGLVRAYHRGFPLDLRDARLQRGDVHFRQSGQLVACAWGEKKRVTTLSTNSRPVVEAAPGRPGPWPDGPGRPRRPQPVGNFNASKEGADAAAHLRTCYSLGREGKKWWRHLIFVLVNTALANAYTVYRLSNVPPPRLPASHLQFRLLLAKQLVAGYAEGRAARRPRRKRDIERVISTEHLSRHVCVRFAGRKRVCVLCSRRGRRTAKGRGVQSSYGCAICNVHLCRVACFLQYHEMAHLPTDFVVDPAVQVVHCPAPGAPRKPRRAAARGPGRRATGKPPARKAAARARQPPANKAKKAKAKGPVTRRTRSRARAVEAPEQSAGEESDCVVVDEHVPKRVKLESEPEDGSDDDYVEEVDESTQVSEAEGEERPDCGGGGCNGGGCGGGGGGDGTLADADRASPGIFVPGDGPPRDFTHGPEPTAAAEGLGGSNPAAESPAGDAADAETPPDATRSTARDDAAGGSCAEWRRRREEEAEGARRALPGKLSSAENSPGDSCERASSEGGAAATDRRAQDGPATPGGAAFPTTEREHATDGERGNRSEDDELMPAADSTRYDADCLPRDQAPEYKPEPVRVYAREASADNLHDAAHGFDAFAASTAARETPRGSARRAFGDSPRASPCCPFARVAASQPGQTAPADGPRDSKPYEFPPQASLRYDSGSALHEPLPDTATGFPRLYPPLPPPPPSQHPHHPLGPVESLARHVASPQHQQHHGYPALGLYPFQELYRPHVPPPLTQPLPRQLRQNKQLQQQRGAASGEAGPLPYGVQDPYAMQRGLYAPHVAPQHGEQ